jgi:hypothetical protein
MPQGSHHSTGSLIPFVGPWWTSLLKSSNKNHAVDRALGAAATLGLSIVILRLVAQAMKSVQQSDNDEQESSSTFKIIQEILKGLFQRKQQQEEKAVLDETVIHTGSCHCRAVAFELAAPRTLVAQHGPGKISYAHTRTRAGNFRFIKGTDHLQIYYVSVPAGAAERNGVEPTVGAHTFCSQCGVHILHAASPNSDTLHVNVSCVDQHGNNKPRIQWNQRTASLSGGVPVPRQWEAEEDVEERRNTWSTMESEDDGTLESSSKLDENPETLDGITPSDHSWKSATADPSPSPGTPSTVGTVGTDSIVSAMRYRSLALEQQDASSEEDSESLPTFTKRPLLPPLSTSSRSVGGVADSPSRKTPTTTTPMMRDQLKYYMSKHLPSATEKPTPKTPTM